MERYTLRTFLYLAFAFCAVAAFGAAGRGDAAWPFGLGLMAAASALYVGATAPCVPRQREPFEHADSFRIGPPPVVPADPARRMPSGASGRAR